MAVFYSFYRTGTGESGEAMSASSQRLVSSLISASVEETFWIYLILSVLQKNPWNLDLSYLFILWAKFKYFYIFEILRTSRIFLEFYFSILTSLNLFEFQM